MWINELNGINFLQTIALDEEVALQCFQFRKIMQFNLDQKWIPLQLAPTFNPYKLNSDQLECASYTIWQISNNWEFIVEIQFKLSEWHVKCHNFRIILLGSFPVCFPFSVRFVSKSFKNEKYDKCVNCQREKRTGNREGEKVSDRNCEIWWLLGIFWA